MSEARRQQPREDEDPDAFMNNQRERLQREREGVLSRRKALDDEVAAIDAKLSRIENYFNPQPKAGGRKAAQRKPRSAPSVDRREAVIAAITKQPGITGAQLIDALGVRGQKQAMQSVSNLLTNMKKA